MSRLLIENCPPYRSYRSSRLYRLRRWITASEIPFVLWFGGAILLAAVCLMVGLFQVT